MAILTKASSMGKPRINNDSDGYRLTIFEAAGIVGAFLFPGSFCVSIVMRQPYSTDSGACIDVSSICSVGLNLGANGAVQGDYFSVSFGTTIVGAIIEYSTIPT
jgi:hypothetical protein